MPNVNRHFPEYVILWNSPDSHANKKHATGGRNLQSQTDFVAEYRGNRYRVHRSAAGEYVLVLDNILGPKQKVADPA